MLLTVLVFIFVLGILVLVHELGHFLAAKCLGIKVEEFGFGLPPRIWGRKIGETLYSLNLLPIGGFVRLYGEDQEENSKWDVRSEKLDTDVLKSGSGKWEEKIPLQEHRNIKASVSRTSHIPHRTSIKRAFFAKKPSQRALVLIAGVLMNFLLGWGIISFLFTQGVMVPTERVHVEKVMGDSPAKKAGVKEGDIILKIKILNPRHQIPNKSQIPNSKSKTERIQSEVEVKSPKNLIEATKKHLGEEIVLVVQRKKEWLTEHVIASKISYSFETKEIKIVPRKEPPEGEGPLGVVISNYEERVYPWYRAPFLGLGESFKLSWQLLVGVGQIVWKLVTFQGVERDVAGPLGIAQLTGEAVKFGKMAILEFLGLLSINLAIINILPFPALDGGRLLFVGIEGATGRRLRPRWEKYIHQTGMAILLILILLVTVNDLLRLFSR